MRAFDDGAAFLSTTTMSLQFSVSGCPLSAPIQSSKRPQFAAGKSFVCSIWTFIVSALSLFVVGCAIHLQRERVVPAVTNQWGTLAGR